MEAKQKAIEFYNNMRNQMRGPAIEANKDNAKRCALLAVQEIQLAVEQIVGWEEHMWTIHEKEQVFYWRLVKEEINKL